MPSRNKVEIMGHLGRDPEMRYTQGGQAVCNFSVATSERWKDKSGEYQEQTEWHRIVVWAKQAENCAEYLAKGSLVFVDGRLQTREWTDKEGGKRQSTEIVAERVTFLDKKGSQGGGQRRQEESFEGPPHDDDDVPF